MSATASPLPDIAVEADLEDMTRDTLRVLLPMTALASWAWAAPIMLLDPQCFLSALGVLLVTTSAAWLGSALSQRCLREAARIYLFGLLVSVTIIAYTYHTPLAFCLYVLVLLVAPMLAGAPMSALLALASVALVLLAGRTGPRLSAADVGVPILLVVLTALTSWVSSRRLHTALGWALNMTRQAQHSAEEARARRAEVRSMLKSLDEAYVRLERSNQALIFAREAADKAYQFKAEFVANVSHELRTPLNIISGFSEMIATAPDSYGGIPLPAPYRGDVMAIHKSARHLTDLINDVLDLSQIDAGKMPITLENASLAQVAREAMEMVEGLAHARGLALQMQVPESLPPLLLDRVRIRQVFLNLLSNAIRFTDRGWIRLSAYPEGQEIVVQVEDTGRGIPPDRLSLAFEAFSQLSEEQVREGTGLGLAVSKKFVDLHGGRMWLESVVGQGTTVGFTLPVSGENQRLGVPRLVRSGGAAKADPEVLVVHDDPAAVKLLERYVPGYRFSMVQSRAELLRSVSEGSPMAIVVDAALARQWDLQGDRWRLPAQPATITCSLPSMRRLGAQFGAVGFLPKPVSREALSDAIARLPRAPRKALIVDDDPDIVRLLARMLRSDHPEMEVLQALGGDEGLQAVNREQPDLLLLDLVMLGVTGYDILRHLQSGGGATQTQTIVVSVRSMEQESIPFQGGFHLDRAAGFNLTETLQVLTAVLAAVAPVSEEASTGGAARPEDRPG